MALSSLVGFFLLFSFCMVYRTRIYTLWDVPWEIIDGVGVQDGGIERGKKFVAWFSLSMPRGKKRRKHIALSEKYIQDLIFSSPPAHLVVAIPRFLIEAYLLCWEQVPGPTAVAVSFSSSWGCHIPSSFCSVQEAYFVTITNQREDADMGITPSPPNFHLPPAAECRREGA